MDLNIILGYGNILAVPLLYLTWTQGLNFLFWSILLTSTSSLFYHLRLTPYSTLMWNLSRYGGIGVTFGCLIRTILFLSLFEQIRVVVTGLIIIYIFSESEKSKDPRSFAYLHLTWRSLSYLLGFYILNR